MHHIDYIGHIDPYAIVCVGGSKDRFAGLEAGPRGAGGHDPARPEHTVRLCPQQSG